MGKMEREVQAEIRRTKINTAVVLTIATVGVIALAAVAPNVVVMLARKGKINPYLKGQNAKRSLTRLIEAGYVKVENGKVSLTPRGESFAALLGEGEYAIRKPKRWDGKWRVLIFDIPQRRARLRHRLRSIFVSLGFYLLQDSVWVYPYDCEDLMTMMKVDLKVGKDVRYIIADKIELDTELRKHFSLPS
jgi:DNA-binding transcriptional regulator PaaX